MRLREWKLGVAVFAAWAATVAISVALAMVSTPARASQVQTSPTAYTATNDSGAIAAGSTFQVFLAAKSTRQGCFIQNTNATDLIYVFVNDGVASKTKAHSYQVAAAGGFFSCTQGGIVIPNEIDITGTSTNDTFAAGDQ